LLFQRGGTDIRPEDAFYATNRALAVPATGTTGLNYASPNCTLSGATNCQIYDSFSQGGVFNVLKFNITAKDPYKTTAAVPTYTTLSVGASPVLVLVSNKDTSGLGKTYTDSNGRTSYLFNDILRSKLSFIFQGNSKSRATFCRRPAGIDHHHPTRRRIRIWPGIASNPPRTVVRNLQHVRVHCCSHGGRQFQPSYQQTHHQRVDQQRRRRPGNVGPGHFLRRNQCGRIPWIIDPGSPSLGWTSGSLNSACGTLSTTGGINKVTNPSGTQNCSDPLFISGTNLSKAPACASGTYLRLRAIGTGQEVPDTLGLNNTGAKFACVSEA